MSELRAWKGGWQACGTRLSAGAGRAHAGAVRPPPQNPEQLSGAPWRWASGTQRRSGDVDGQGLWEEVSRQVFSESAAPLAEETGTLVPIGTRKGAGPLDADTGCVCVGGGSRCS